MNSENLLPFYDKCKKDIYKSDYLLKRGISSKTIEANNIGFDEEHHTIVFPIDEESCETRSTEPGNQTRYYKKGKAKIFNSIALKGSKPVIVTEGIIDSLSILEAGCDAVNAVSLCSVNNTGLFLEKTKQEKAIPPIIIALDNDETGKAAAQKLYAELKKLNTVSIIANLYGENKDANEALIHSKSDLTNEIIKVVDSVSKMPSCEHDEHSINPQAFINHIIEQHGIPKLDTPFKRLNNELGGLKNELYTFGAISSLGKSTFVIQILDWLAANGHPIIFYSLEADVYSIMAKSLSRIMLKNSIVRSGNAEMALDSSKVKDISSFSPENYDVFKQSIQQYANFSDRIHVYQREDGCKVEDISAVVDRFIKNTGTKPIVFIDYLQILDVNKNVNSSKEAIDEAIANLKSLCTKFLIPVIVISSLNRQSYNAPVTLASFKESGSIEYTSDVVIGLQYKGVDDKNFDLKAVRAKPCQDIELCILKNRNGSSGAVIDYLFYPRFSNYEEA